MGRIEMIKVGWSFFGVVEMTREWCVICAKQRWHEKVEKSVCLACCNIVEEEQVEEAPKFQIERFIKEGV